MDSPAYFAPASRVDVARCVPAFHRILPAGPWSVVSYSHPFAGVGALAWWSDCAQPEPPAGAWTTSPDGLLYAPPATLPTQAELAKAHGPRGIDVTLASGVVVTMPLASLAPRKLSLTRATTGEYADAYGRLAYQVREKLTAAGAGGIDILDPDVITLVATGLGLAYRVTPELLDDLGWLSDVDIDPLLCALMGSDPKAFAGDATPSRSPAGA